VKGHAAMLELNDYPSDLESCITLPNRQRLRIRPLHPDEDGPVRELDAHLSTRTRYLRFLSPLPSLPDSLLRLLVSVDYQRRVTLIAESDARDRHEVVAMGSFGAIGESTAEVALVVRDDWQHQGVGTALAGRVLQAAEHRGFERFVVHVLSENTVIRRLLKRVGRVMSSTTRMGLSEVTFIARPAAPPSGCRARS
jgi:acetyltransferase